MTPPLWQNTKKKKKTKKKPLDESERGECKSWLETLHLKNEDHGIWSHHFMANRWGNNGNSYKFYLFCLKITADGGCSHAIKRHLLLGRKAMTNLDGILKSRDNTLPTRVRLVKTIVFPVVTYGCENWTIKNWCFWTLVLEKTFEGPLDCKEMKPVHPKGNQSWIFTGRTDAEAEAQYFGHLMRRTDSLEKTLMLRKMKAGGKGNDRGWDGWMASPTRWTWVWASSRSWW